MADRGDPERLHSASDELGASRWCRGCGRWVDLIDWSNHKDHYP